MEDLTYLRGTAGTEFTVNSQLAAVENIRRPYILEFVVEPSTMLGADRGVSTSLPVNTMPGCAWRGNQYKKTEVAVGRADVRGGLLVRTPRSR